MAKSSKLKPSESLQELVNRAAFLSTEVQMCFGELVGDADWEADFGAAAPALTFTGVVAGSESTTTEPDRESTDSSTQDLALRVHLAGTLAESQGTWHWGWDNINEFPEPVVAGATQILDFGRSREVPELTSMEIQADSDQAARLMMAAKLATDIWAHYPAETGPHSAAWLLVQGPELALEQPSIRPVVTAMAASLQQIDVTDHRLALESYATLRGFPLAPLDDGLRILAADGSADVTFDELGRLTNCQVHAPLEGEAADQFTAAGTPVPQAAISAEQIAEQLARQPRPVEEKAAPQPPVADQPVDAPAAEEAPSSAPEASEPRIPGDQPAESEQSTAQEPAAQESVSERESAPVEQPEKSEQPGDSEQPAEPEEPTESEAPKKKGFFKKLFGR